MTLSPTDSLGLALLNKPKGKTSFHLVSVLRKLLNVRCIGHTGTLDPFATGLMVMLVGRPYTKRADEFLLGTKEYKACARLGQETDTYDSDGQITASSDKVPTLLEIEEALTDFQGKIMQIPPMFSAKKIKGQRLYKLARQGIEVKREPREVTVDVKVLSYNYPHLELYVKCSSGTYIRSIAYDLGQKLGCLAHLEGLVRTKLGPFSLEDAQDLSELTDSSMIKLRRNF